MSLSVILDPDARAEFDEAYERYQAHEVGLGEAFADAVQIVLERVAEQPALYRLVFGNIRRAVVKGFPYCVYYREEPTRVRVLSVFHAKRDPKVWQSRG